MHAYRHRLCGVVVVVLLLAGRGNAQGPTISSSSVGYIDPAIPASMFRLRFDAAFNDRAPTRGEFLLARTPGPGLPLPERRVDYQDLAAYTEVAIDPQFSLFSEIPYRMMNPEINRNHSGFSDISAGIKWAIIYDPNFVTTLQFLVRTPTGDSHQGLGTDHFSLEPALLTYWDLSSGLALEAETRITTPLGGNNGFASDVLRYGLGLKWELYNDGDFAFAPVVEAVGWTFLDGKKTLVAADGTATVSSASGDTIVNLKAGMRFAVVGMGDLYVGYGFPITGARRYAEIYRVEWRMAF